MKSINFQKRNVYFVKNSELILAEAGGTCPNPIRIIYLVFPKVRLLGLNTVATFKLTSVSLTNFRIVYRDFRQDP